MGRVRPMLKRTCLVCGSELRGNNSYKVGYGEGKSDVKKHMSGVW